jgi:hypothetical protein
MHNIDRRKLMVGGTVGAAAVVVGLPALPEGPGKLSALVKRYIEEVAAFCSDPRADDDDLYLGPQPMDVTLRELVGVPVRNVDDAVAAVDWIIYEGKNSDINFGGDGIFGQVTESLAHALRNYLRANQI